MAHLKLPRRLPPGVSFPPAITAPIAPPTVRLLLGRREFLKAAGVLLAALTLPMTRARQAYARARGRFFTRQEFATLEALVDRVLPPDQDPGAKAMGAADYIEGMLTAFDGRGAPRIFAGGPFSGRNPYPNPHTGRPSHRRPPNRFKHFLPLTPRQELRWRAEIFGSAAVAGADFNDAALGPMTGLRDLYRQGIAQVDAAAQAMAGAPFVGLSTDQQDAVMNALDVPGTLPTDARRGATFFDLLFEHTLEGCFGAPEYGGNRHLSGWKFVGLEGDDQPLGYSIYSQPKDDYVERADHPMSTPNPDELSASGALSPRPLSGDTQYVEGIIGALAGIFTSGEKC
jgi:hypothetical protein